MNNILFLCVIKLKNMGNKNTEYNIDFFISLFEKAKDSEWGQGDIDNKCVFFQCCGEATYFGARQKALTNIFQKYYKSTSKIFWTRQLVLTDINDGNDKNFKQKSPKKRVLAACYFVKGKIALEEAKKIIRSANSVI